MKISCNKLKSYIKNSENIDFVKVWDLFSIRSAEVENIEIKGSNIEGVVVGKILTCNPHPESKKLSLLTVDIGTEKLDIVCGAPNVKVGLKVALIQVGGHLGEITISKRPILGSVSYGMCLSEVELGIGDDGDGIIELPDHFEVGKDIKEYLPIDDIIVEIDNKSLTNRPDMWGHYGIAREIAAITNCELLPLPVEKIPNNSLDLDIQIKSDLCHRYTGLKLENITVKETPLNMKIFLYYVGMRSISLLVDLTNYIMLEIGQPMHAFDASVVKNIEVGMASENSKFTTLDNIERTLSKDNLMIKNGNEYFAIAGVMGGIRSEILETTNTIFLESACFDATSVRKTSTDLGLRTESSTRFEKALDPNMTITAIQRYVKLLSSVDNNFTYASNVTDVYPNVLEEKKVTLSKELLKKYMGIELEDNEVKRILESLEFKVEIAQDEYVVTVPTFRATKDISISEDLIEEIARMYGYDNLTPEPLKLELNFTNLENTIQEEYNVKKFLANKYQFNEVHTYLWYKTAFLNKLKINKENVELVHRNEDNILRDDLNLSLLEVAYENLKYTNHLNIFEIATIIDEGKNKRVLALLIADSYKNIDKSYDLAKDVAYKLFKTLRNISVTFSKSEVSDYYDNELTYAIKYEELTLGFIKVFNSTVSKEVAKKKSFVNIKIDFDLLMELPKKEVIHTEISKYPTSELDYTVIMPIDSKYSTLEKILMEFNSPIIKTYKLIGTYKSDTELKYTIRYVVGLNDKTLTNEELQDFKDKFITHIKNNNLSIME